VEEITGLKYTVILNDSEESEEQNKTNIAIRVIVDHVRAVALLLLTDNCLQQEQDM
jgi:alanyl-tRNA synthetase